MKPLIVPFFLPQKGCPEACIYCDQHRITGSRPELPTPDEIKFRIEEALWGRVGEEAQAAFYGGTFTSLSRRRQETLLSAVRPFIDDGRIRGIRLSTRPDALDGERIEFLKQRGVATIEIGAQSLDDEVLKQSRRGHTAAQVKESGNLVKKAGLRLGLQLLPGLPGEDRASRELTLTETLAIRPHEARLYPLLVVKGTQLADEYEAGKYQPLSLEEAVEVCARFYVGLTRAGIIVIRTGLQAGVDLESNVMAGPYHPAFGHLVKAEAFRQALARVLASGPSSADPVILVSPKDISEALGHQRANLICLKDRFNLPSLCVKSDPSLARGWFSWQGRTFSVIESAGT